MRDTLKLRDSLAQFSGTDQWHNWSLLFRQDLLTDGTKFLAEEAGAFWLMDAVASWQRDRIVRKEEFQVWTLEKTNLRQGVWILSADDGDDHVIATQLIEYSDFPLASIKLYAARNSKGGVTIMLPGEY